MWVGDREGIERTGMTPVAQLVDWEMAAMDFRKEGEGILMAPGRAIPRLLARHGLRFSEIALFEIHEAFAAQVLGNVKAASDPVYRHEKAHVAVDLGPFDWSRVNPHGGSLALGHPFAATGARILSQAVKEMTSLPPDSFAVVSVCADGGQGTVALLKRTSVRRGKPRLRHDRVRAMITHPKLTIRSISATPVNVPMKRKLGTSAQRIENAPLLLVDLQTEEGVSGHSYAFCYLPSIARSLVPVVADLSGALVGARVVAARRRRTGGALFQATRTVGSPHDGGLGARRRGVGRLGDRGGGAARDVSRRGDRSDPGLQQQRPRHHVAGSGGRRGRRTPRRRISRHEAAAWVGQTARTIWRRSGPSANAYRTRSP